MIASETPELPPKTKGGAIVAVATLLLTGVTVVALFFATDTFLVLNGRDCDGCIVRERQCVGIVHLADLRDGSRGHCIGIPVGPWYCFRNVRSQDGDVPVACPPAR